MVSAALRRYASEDLNRQMSEYSLGIDIGGTFTDLVIHDHDTGRRWGSKVLTTHADPQQGVVAGVRTILAESRLDPRGIGRVVHATTLFTNALIERKGAPTGLLVTEGFRDMLEIGRERKYDLYDIGIENPAPLVPRNLRLGVSERMRADGSVAEPLDAAQLLRRSMCCARVARFELRCRPHARSIAA